MVLGAKASSLIDLDLRRRGPVMRRGRDGACSDRRNVATVTLHIPGIASA